MADNNTTAVADDEWEVKPPPKKAGGEDEWSVNSPTPQAPNPVTGQGMEQSAMQQAHSMFAPTEGQGYYDARGIHVAGPHGEKLSLLDKAGADQTAQENRHSGYVHHALNSLTPFTNASMVLAPASGIGESIASKGLGPTISAVAKPVIRTTLGAVGGSAAGGYGGRELGKIVGHPEEGAQIGATAGGLVGGLFGGMNREPPEPAPFSKVSTSSGPYRGPSSVQSPFEVPASSSIRLKPRIAPGPSIPEGGLPGESTGPSLFESGAGPDAKRVGNEGSAARWTNERAQELAGKGNRQAIMTLGRRGIEAPPNTRYVMGDQDFDRVTYNPKEVTHFSPTGEPIREMEVPEKGSRSRIAAPASGVQGAKVPIPAEAVRYEIDKNGLKWAIRGDYRVTIPKRIPEGDIESYAMDKLKEQADIHKSMGGKDITF
jgi:hypothetical protein